MTKQLSTTNNNEENASLDYASMQKMQKLEALDRSKARTDKLVMAVVILAIFFVVFNIRLFIAPVSVIGSSMVPTYSSGQMLLSRNISFAKELNYGDVICFKNQETAGELYIKRIEGKPGDTIWINDGILYRNNEIVDEGFDQITNGGMFSEPVTLKDDEYFVMGDNRNYSKDSRHIGPIHYNDINYMVFK